MATFVTLEGIEGSGKSTLQAKLAKALEETGKEVVITREPGATALGQNIRKILLDPKNREINSLTELLLFSADRAQHISEIIWPALQRDAIVICDRFYHSTIAYQGYGRDLPLNLLEHLNSITTGGLEPNLVLLLDLDPEIGLKRVTSPNRFEEQSLEFHRKVRNGFLELAKHTPDNFHLIDASLSEDEVFTQALATIKEKMG